jgi:tetratricopeptide (TPR) repeat protein
MMARGWFKGKGVLLGLLATSVAVWGQSQTPTPPPTRPTQRTGATVPSPASQPEPSAVQLFQEAAAHIEKENYSAAIPLLKKALVLAPREGRIHHYLAYAYWRTDQFDAAKKEFQRALELEPNNAYTQYFLARILYNEGENDQAVRLYEAIVASGTPIYDTYPRLGQAYFRQGNLAKALEMTQLALEQTPWDGALHFQLAKIYRQMGRNEDAAREYETSNRLKRTDQASIQRLLQLSEAARTNQRETVLQLREEILSEPSKDPEILTWLGSLLGQAGYYQEARQPLELALERDPSSYEANFNLGLTLARLERYAEAEASLKKAVNLRPDSFGANSVLGVLYVNQGRNREAIERLRAAQQTRPDNVRVLALLGQQYLQGWYIEEGIKTFEQVVVLSPREAKFRYLLIDAYQKTKDYEKAYQVAQETLKLFPDDPQAHYQVGLQLARLGRYQEGRPYFEAALRLDPSFVAAHNWLGNLQLRNGEYDAALASFQKAKSLEPHNLDCLRGIGQSLLRLKRYPEARAEIEKAIRVHAEDSELYFQLSQVETRLGNREKASEAAGIFERLRAKEIQKEDTEKPRKFEAQTQGQ